MSDKQTQLEAKTAELDHERGIVSANDAVIKQLREENTQMEAGMTSNAQMIDELRKEIARLEALVSSQPSQASQAQIPALGPLQELEKLAEEAKKKAKQIQDIQQSQQALPVMEEGAEHEAGSGIPASSSEQSFKPLDPKFTEKEQELLKEDFVDAMKQTIHGRAKPIFQHYWNPNQTRAYDFNWSNEFVIEDDLKKFKENIALKDREQFELKLLQLLVKEDISTFVQFAKAKVEKLEAKSIEEVYKHVFQKVLSDSDSSSVSSEPVQIPDTLPPASPAANSGNRAEIDEMWKWAVGKDYYQKTNGQRKSDASKNDQEKFRKAFHDSKDTDKYALLQWMIENKLLPGRADVIKYYKDIAEKKHLLNKYGTRGGKGKQRDIQEVYKDLIARPQAFETQISAYCMKNLFV